MLNVFCTDCGWDGEDSDLAESEELETTEFWGMRETTCKTIVRCPDCGSTNIVDELDEDEEYDDE